MDPKTLRVAVAVVVIAAAAYLGLRYTGFKPGQSATAGYQAVFLTNGQVYFGKLKVGARDVSLTDIYYLQVQQQVQPEQQNQQQQPQISLVKLGNELHGPQDKMVINKDHVLFWEDLKDDGKVVTAIKDHKAGKTSQ